MASQLFWRTRAASMFRGMDGAVVNKPMHKMLRVESLLFFSIVI